MIHTHSVPRGNENPGDLWVKAGAAVTADDFLWTVFPDEMIKLLVSKPNIIFSMACGSTFVDADSDRAWASFARR